MHAVIDFDQAVYACGFASEGEPQAHTNRLLQNKIDQILKDTEATSHQIYIGGKGNFRDELDFSYKANRTAPRPESYDKSREYLIEHQGAKLVDGMETDDMVSLLLYKDFIVAGRDKANVICCSPDKDLNNTPGWHYNPQKRTKAFITRRQADRHFYYQLLAGDPTDNIKGLPRSTERMREEFGLRKTKGFGAKSAAAVIKSDEFGNGYSRPLICYSMWGTDEGMTMEDTFDYMELQGKLLWMAREVNEDGSPVQFKADKGLFEKYWNIEGKF